MERRCEAPAHVQEPHDEGLNVQSLLEIQYNYLFCQMWLNIVIFTNIGHVVQLKTQKTLNVTV